MALSKGQYGYFMADNSEIYLLSLKFVHMNKT